MERSGKGFERSQAFAKEAWDAIIDGLSSPRAPKTGLWPSKPTVSFAALRSPSTRAPEQSQAQEAGTHPRCS